MAVLDIQTGSVTVTTASNTATVSSFTLANSVLFMSARGGSSSCTESLITGEVTNTTTLTFSRDSATGNSLIVEFALVELDTDVDVQHVTYTTSGTTAISAVTAAQTFVRSLGCRNQGGTFGDDDNVQLDLPTTTTVGHTITGAVVGQVGNLQVVDWTDADVQEINKTLNNVTSADETITSVTEAQTFVCGSMRSAATLTMAHLFGLQLFSATAIRFSSYTAIATDQISTSYVVDLGADWAVQRGQESVGSGTTTSNVSITAVDTGKSWANLATASQMTSAGRVNVADDAFSQAFHTHKFSVSSTLQLQRAASGNAATVSWEVITEDPVLTCDQEGFRFRKDDGSESAATWLVAQDTDISRGKLQPARLRILTDYTGDPATTALKMQFRKVGDPTSEWEDLA